MPYAHIRKLIPRSLDRRVKISQEMREEIESLHAQGVAIRAITRKIGTVSRRSIVFLIFPDRLERHKKLQKELRKDGRYKPTKAEWAKTQREHRRYKESIKDKLE